MINDLAVHQKWKYHCLWTFSVSVYLKSQEWRGRGLGHVLGQQPPLQYQLADVCRLSIVRQWPGMPDSCMRGYGVDSGQRSPNLAPFSQQLQCAVQYDILLLLTNLQRRGIRHGLWGMGYSAVQHYCIHTHTRLTALCPGPPGWAGTRKVKPVLDFTEARDSEWQWHQLGHMQVCTSLRTDNHAGTPPLSFLQAGCPSCRPTNSVKALRANAALLYTEVHIVVSVCWRLCGLGVHLRTAVRCCVMIGPWCEARPGLSDIRDVIAAGAVSTGDAHAAVANETHAGARSSDIRLNVKSRRNHSMRVPLLVISHTSQLSVTWTQFLEGKASTPPIFSQCVN